MLLYFSKHGNTKNFACFHLRYVVPVCYQIIDDWLALINEVGRKVAIDLNFDLLSRLGLFSMQYGIISAKSFKVYI